MNSSRVSGEIAEHESILPATLWLMMIYARRSVIKIYAPYLLANI